MDPKEPVRICSDPAYIEAFKRNLFEDALLVIASELLVDAPAIAAMQRLGVYHRFVHLTRAVLHARANPETAAEAAIAEAMRRLPIAERPAPFDELTEPLRKGPHTS